MFRWVLPAAVLVCTALVSAAQVETLGDVSLAVPKGWMYRHNLGTDFAAVELEQGRDFWMIAIYPAANSGGNADEDLKAAWRQIVLPQEGIESPLPPYREIARSAGYSGKWAEGGGHAGEIYIRVYVLETGKGFIPVTVMCKDAASWAAQEAMVNAMIGSIRQAPLRATAIKSSIGIADLAGEWSSAGTEAPGSGPGYGARYRISANGAFAYKMTGEVNHHFTSEDDSGEIELDGDSITFKGQNHVVRYRFMSLQTAVNGDALITLAPMGGGEGSETQIWSRAARAASAGQ